MSRRNTRVSARQQLLRAYTCIGAAVLSRVKNGKLETGVIGFLHYSVVGLKHAREGWSSD